MSFLWNKLTEWLKEMLVGGIMGNLTGLFDSVNDQVAEIAGTIGQTPQGWNGGVFSMVRSLSDTVIVPIAGVILAILMTMEFIQMIIDRNNMNDIRNVYTTDTVTQKFLTLRRMQERLKEELGTDGYMDYGLMICQANGRPIMTEHLNQRFKEILIAVNDPDVPTEGIVFHSIRHTSAGLKLKLSKGDVKSEQGDGGWNTPDMVTKRYAHILDEDRRNLAEAMETSFLSERRWQRVESTAHTALSANECASNNRSCRCTGCATAH